MSVPVQSIALVESQATLRFSSNVPQDWTVRLRVETPMLAEVRAEIGPGNVAQVSVPRSLLGRHFELSLVDSAGQSHLVATGSFSAGTTTDPQDFTYSPDNDSQVFQTYVHSQDSASDTWTIEHGLGRWPSVHVVDSAGTEVQGGVQFINENQVELTFSAPFSGRAFIGG